jgi:hypothetical protein
MGRSRGSLFAASRRAPIEEVTAPIPNLPTIHHYNCEQWPKIDKREVTMLGPPACTDAPGPTPCSVRGSTA